MFKLSGAFVCVLSALCVATEAAERWEPVITDDTFDNYRNLESQWHYLYPWGPDHNGTARMYGSPADRNHITIDNGVLTLKASRIYWDEGYSTAPGFSHVPIHYHSGAIHAKHVVLVNEQFPDYELEARIRAPSGHGAWPAFWITGQHSWPPEIDIMEFKGSRYNWQNTYDGAWEETLSYVANPGDWHTYRIWMTKVNERDVHIHYYIDDQWKARHTGSNFVGQPMNIILNLQMEGSSGNSGPHQDTTMHVDWVKVGRTVVEDDDALVRLYQHCNYQGYSLSLMPGSYTLAELRAQGMRNDDVSSLRVPTGYRAKLYQHDAFHGEVLEKNDDDDCLVNDNFNDRLSSLVIER